MAADDEPRAGPHRSRCAHEYLFAEGFHLGTHQKADLHPAKQRRDQNDGEEASARQDTQQHGKFYRRDEISAKAGDAEHRLDKDGPRGGADEHWQEHGDHRQRRIAQNVLEYDPAFGKALGAQGGDEGFVQDVQHGRPRIAGVGGHGNGGIGGEGQNPAVRFAQPEEGSQFSQTAKIRISSNEVTMTGIVRPRVAKTKAR